MELTKLNTMDEINISLPCGFSAKYKDIFYNNDKFPCPVCKIHDLTSQECLNMTKNKILLNEIKLDQKKNQYEELMKEFENYKNDPKHFIDESFDCLKREVDLRREEIKLMLNKEIDDYHDGLLEKIDMERDLKLKVIEERIQNTELFDLASFKIDENLDIHSKLEFYSKGKIKIDNGISLVQNIIHDFQEPNFKLSDCDDDIDIVKLFGEFYLKEETIIILNGDEIDDDSRAEATIQFKIKNFSLLKDKKNFDLYSKNCIVRYFKWYISIELNEEDEEMGFFLHCNSTAKSNIFPVNAIAVFSLLNKSDSNKDLIRNYEHLFGENDWGKGYPEFTTIKEIMNPTNGYYDANDDSITLKAFIKAELPQKNLHIDDDDDDDDDDHE